MTQEEAIDIIRDAGFGYLATTEGDQPRVREANRDSARGEAPRPSAKAPPRRGHDDGRDPDGDADRGGAPAWRGGSPHDRDKGAPEALSRAVCAACGTIGAMKMRTIGLNGSLSRKGNVKAEEESSDAAAFDSVAGCNAAGDFLPPDFCIKLLLRY